MKKIKKNGLILIFFSCLVLYFAVKNDFFTILNAIINANYLWIFFALAIMVFIWFLKSLALFEIVKLYPQKIKLKQVFQQITITQFFNGITPFASGGQPMQAYMLKASGMKITQASNIIIQDFVIYQFSLVFLTTVAVVINFFFHYLPSSLLLKQLTVIGYLVNLFVAIVLVIISSSNKALKKCSHLLIKILVKIKLVKKEGNKLKKIDEKIDEFHEGATLLKKNKKTVILGFLYNSLSLLLYFLIPIFVFKSVDSSLSLSLSEIMVTTAYIVIIGAFIPTPGGTGGIEYSFLDFFKKLVSQGPLSAIMLIWRFITYYFGMIIGGVTFNVTGGTKNENRIV